MAGKEQQVAAADAAIARIESTIAELEAVMANPKSGADRFAAAERSLVSARAALALAEAARRKLDA